MRERPFLSPAGFHAVVRDFGLEVALECRIEALQTLVTRHRWEAVGAECARDLENARAALEHVRARTPIMG